MNRGPRSALEPVFGGSGRSLRFSEIEKFRDPIWRVSNLYSIRETWRESDTLSATAAAIAGPRHALPARAQANRYPQGAPDRFLDLLGVICADQLCWNTGKQVSLVGKTQEDARQKLKNITVLAYDSLHPELKDRFVVSRANSGEFGVRFFEYEAAQTSTMFAGTHARRGSNFFVWISEWGRDSLTPISIAEMLISLSAPA